MPDTLPTKCATSPGGVPPAAPPLPALSAPVSEPRVSSTSDDADDEYIGEDHDELFGYAHAAEEVGSDGEDGAFSASSGPNRCQYCNVKSARFKCELCGVYLHYPTSGKGGIDLPCAARYHDRNFCKFCYGDDAPSPKHTTHTVDPDVDIMREAKQPFREENVVDAGGHRIITVVNTEHTQ